MCVVRDDADKFRSPAVVEVGVGSTLSGRASIVAGRSADNRVASNDGDELNVNRGVPATSQKDALRSFQVNFDLGASFTLLASRWM